MSDDTSNTDHVLSDEQGIINTDWATETQEDYERACRARMAPGYVGRPLGTSDGIDWDEARRKQQAFIADRIANAPRIQPNAEGKYEHTCCGPQEPKRPGRDLWRGLHDADHQRDLHGLVAAAVREAEDLYGETLTEVDVPLERYYSRVRALHRLEGPTRSDEVLLPGFTQADLAYSVTEPEGRDLRKRDVILNDIDDEHDERHWFYKHPMCRVCYPESIARVRLNRWMVLNPGRVPRDTWDGIAPEDAKTSGTRLRKTYMSLGDLAALPPASMLVKEFVPLGGLGYITGRDASFKTFLALDLALCITAEKATMLDRDLQVRGHHRALYLAGEGVRSFSKRVYSWAHHHGIEPDALEPNLVIRNGTVDLYSGSEEFEALLAFIEVAQPTLVVIDTLNRSAGGAEQNSASDMSVITARLDKIKAVAGPDATVIVLAHTDKADNDARGSSAIEDDADFVLHCKKTTPTGLKVEIAKMKDGESGQTYEFTMLEIDGGLGQSLVISTDVKDAPKWVSEDLEARILSVLRAYHGHDKPTVGQIITSLKEDGTGNPATRPSVYRVMGTLEADGRVLGEKTGNMASSPKRFWLSPSYVADLPAHVKQDIGEQA